MTIEQGNASAGASESASVNTSTPSPAANTQVATGQTTSTAEGNPAGTEGATTQAPQYTPNFKYKVLDQEREFDEWLRPVVKDADSEKRVRDLLERAYGIDAVKADRTKIRESFQTLQQEKAAVESSLNTLSTMVRSRDHRFFKAAQIPDDFVLEAAHRILQEKEMSPEQRAQLQHQRSLEEKYHETVSQNELLMQEHQKTATQYRDFELQNTLQSSEVSPIVQIFDSKVGPGKFRAEVVRLGQWYWTTQGKDKPVKELVQEVGNMARAFIGENSGVTAGQQAPANVVTTQTAPTQQVIPNIEGKGVSPAKKAFNSIDDLKAMRKARSA